MLFFADFFLSFTFWLSFVSKVLSIGSLPVDLGCECFFFDETLDFLGFFCSPFLTKKYSLPFYYSFVLRLPFKRVFSFSMFLGLACFGFILFEMTINFIEGIDGTDCFWYNDSLLFCDLMTIDSLELDLKLGDFERDGLGFLCFVELISFLDLLYFLFVCFSLLFLLFGSIRENLFYLSDYLLPLVFLMIVPLPFDKCEINPSSWSLQIIDVSRKFFSSFRKIISSNNFL